jgi:hypothetical protein
MRRIVKRNLIIGRLGEMLLGSNSERLTDDGRGNLTVTARRVATRCQNCRRPITAENEQRGSCDYCRTRSLCSQCDVSCRVCSRRLCWYCKRGYVSSANHSVVYTVCPICLVRLRQRQAFEDQMLIRKAALQSQILRQREIARMQALQLQAAHYRMAGQIQAARLRTMGQLALIKEINRARLELAKLRYDYVRHLR